MGLSQRKVSVCSTDITDVKLYCSIESIPAMQNSEIEMLEVKFTELCSVKPLVEYLDRVRDFTSMCYHCSIHQNQSNSGHAALTGYSETFREMCYIFQLFKDLT